MPKMEKITDTFENILSDKVYFLNLTMPKSGESDSCFIQYNYRRLSSIQFLIRKSVTGVTLLKFF